MNIPVTFVPSTHKIFVEVIPPTCGHENISETTFEEDVQIDGSFDHDYRLVEMLVCDGCGATKTKADFDWVPAWV